MKIILKLEVKSSLVLCDTHLEHNDFRFAVKCTTLNEMKQRNKVNVFETNTKTLVKKK